MRGRAKVALGASVEPARRRCRTGQACRARLRARPTGWHAAALRHAPTPSAVERRRRSQMHASMPSRLRRARSMQVPGPNGDAACEVGPSAPPSSVGRTTWAGAIPRSWRRAALSTFTCDRRSLHAPARVVAFAAPPSLARRSPPSARATGLELAPRASASSPTDAVQDRDRPDHAAAGPSRARPIVRDRLRTSSCTTQVVVIRSRDCESARRRTSTPAAASPGTSRRRLRAVPVRRWLDMRQRPPGFLGAGVYDCTFTLTVISPATYAAQAGNTYVSTFAAAPQGSAARSRGASCSRGRASHRPGPRSDAALAARPAEGATTSRRRPEPTPRRRPRSSRSPRSA